MVTVFGANGNQGEYEIDHSYMIDSTAACGLARFGNNSRNGDTFTISFWVKRTRLGTNQILVASKVEDSGSNAFVFQFTDADKIQIMGQPQAGTTGAGNNRTVILTTAVYRDPAAWYHIVYRHDTTQGTAGNRHRLYVNGVQQLFTFVATPRAKKYLANKKFNKYALDNIPLGRIATESDVATAITFLSSNAASMITGTNIIIDGGWTAK